MIRIERDPSIRPRQIERPEAPVAAETSRALVPVSKPAASAPALRRPLGSAPFLAQLCAHALGEAQTRPRRRATPQEARAAYAQPGQIASRYLKSA